MAVSDSHFNRIMYLKPPPRYIPSIFCSCMYTNYSHVFSKLMALLSQDICRRQGILVASINQVIDVSSVEEARMSFVETSDPDQSHGDLQLLGQN